MKIIQMLPSLAFGDAVSNDALAIREVLSRMGYETRIYAENIQYKLQGQARAYRRMERTRKSDVVLYHHSIGADMAFDFEKLSCRKVMIYHNITPPEFFDGYDNRSKRLMVYGQATTKCLADKVDYCLADSEYNKQELRAMGYTCPIDVRPVFIPLLDYEKKPSKKILDRYADDGYTNILFVGRISPNKKQEDIIRAFYYYKNIGKELAAAGITRVEREHLLISKVFVNGQSEMTNETGSCVETVHEFIVHQSRVAYIHKLYAYETQPAAHNIEQCGQIFKFAV